MTRATKFVGNISFRGIENGILVQVSTTRGDEKAELTGEYYFTSIQEASAWAHKVITGEIQ